MPKTFKQEIIFGILMVLFMAYAMICYNMAIALNGLSNEILLNGLKELPLIAVIAFIIEFLCVGKLAKKLAFSKFNPKETNPFIMTVAISCFTVMFMCPIMSLISCSVFHFMGFKNLVVNFISATIRNFPMALLYQLFFAGPIVRFIFNKIFK